MPDFTSEIKKIDPSEQWRDNLKFRAYDTESSTMIYFDIFNKYICDLIREHPEKFIVTESTGLKDRTGKFLFVGDLFKPNGKTPHDTKLYRIWKIPGGFVINSKNMYFEKEILYDFPMITEPLSDPQTAGWLNHNCDVVGNIYENPELFLGTTFKDRF